MMKILEIAKKYTIYLTILLLPLVVFPLFANPFATSKILILAYGVCIALLLKAAITLVRGSLEISIGKFDLGVYLLAIAYTVSSIVRTPNKMEAFFLPGTATLVIASSLLYFLINDLKKKEKKTAAVFLLVSGILTSLISLLSFSQILAKIPQLPIFMKDTLFTTMGGYLPVAVFLVALLPMGASFLISEKEGAKKLFWTVSLIVVILGLGISVFNILPGKNTAPRLPSFATSWSISVDTLKESPFLGMGPGNYLTAFNRFRPLSYNQTDLWNVRFTSARNLYLTVLTETGFLGAIAILLVLIGVYRHAISNKKRFLTFKGVKSSSFVSLVLLLFILLFFSASQTALFLLFVLLALGQETKEISLNLSAQGTDSPIASRLPTILISVPVILALVAFGYYGSRALAAEATFKRSIDALTKNEGVTTYNLMRQAINLNPFVDRYHGSYAQVNLALAQNIAQNEQLTDQDRDTITQLIQQAIGEAKAVVTLNPQRAGNWELLARTYQSILAFAQGADAFAVQSYSQAVALDPTNPDLRIALGSLHYALGQYDEAIRTLELATLAKPDHANAHYNLAVSFREKGEIEKAINEMTTVLSLVDRDSQDYEIAKAELENLEKRRGETVEEAGETLTPPQGQEQVIKPPLELPEGAEPPEGPGEVEETP